MVDLKRKGEKVAFRYLFVISIAGEGKREGGTGFKIKVWKKFSGK